MEKSDAMTKIVVETDLTKLSTKITINGKELKGTITALIIRMNKHTKGVKFTVKSPVVNIKKMADGTTRTSTPSKEFDLNDEDQVKALLENQEFWERHTNMEVEVPTKTQKKKDKKLIEDEK